MKEPCMRYAKFVPQKSICLTMVLGLVLFSPSFVAQSDAGDNRPEERIANESAALNLARRATATVSSTRTDHTADKAIDGVVGDHWSGWLPGWNVENAWFELSFPEPVQVGKIDIHTGQKMGYMLSDFDVVIKTKDKSFIPKGGAIRGNITTTVEIELDEVIDGVTGLRVKWENTRYEAISEIAVYSQRDTKPFTDLRVDSDLPVIRRDLHQTGINQIGYLSSQPKVFTAPLSEDGSRFTIKAEGSDRVLFEGTIKVHKGDFSDFQPASSDRHYRIEVSGGNLKTNQSHPFLITESLYEDQYWQSSVDFLIDTRSVVGNHASAYGGCPWRDGTYYDAIIPALVKLYAANPELIESMPNQIDWEADKKRIMHPDFRLASDDKKDFGALFATRQYYRLAPPRADAPDVVKLIHGGAGYYLVNPATHDPSHDPLGRQIHPQTVEQVAYVLWAWPMLEKWLPQSFYDRCHDFCFAYWQDKQDTDSLEISPKWHPDTYVHEDSMRSGGRTVLRHPYKGRHAPGHSIVPNLMMYEVAKRGNRSDAPIYLQAAVKQAEWIIENLDWNNPRTTKGHRMSEHRTIPNLVWLLQRYPEEAPAGLKEKIEEWARIAVKRSDNMWDFRRYNEEHWTIPDMNEVGNSLSLPAIGIAASWVIEDEALKRRLMEMAYASIDHVFGRNPRLATAVALPELGFPEIEQGWPFHFIEDLCARLELCRGSISSLPGSEMYPFNPEGSFRHEEGWVNYGASWCISLAYLKWNADEALPHLAIPNP